MKLDISSDYIPVKFSELEVGDVFRPADREYCCLKIASNGDSDVNAVDFENYYEWVFHYNTLVYKAKSANLSVKF